LRVFTELHGEARFDDAVVAASPLVASDGSVSPLQSPLRSRATATIGLVWQHRNGFFVGAGLNHDFIGRSRDDGAAAGEGLDKSRLADYTDFLIRVGYHPGARVYVPPPPPPPPTPPAPPANRPPTVRARCEPCTVEVGKSSTVTGEATDPDGDRLGYRWTAPSGSFANAAERQTPWTAPMQEGPVPVTITVDDGKGETATDTVTIQVVRPPQKTYVFEDVHFDFDRYSLRADASRVLDEVLAALKESPDLRVEIEGHTCNIGTAEYNLALGERRAASAREYLISRGVPAERLSTVSYGEEKPKHDNSREETRRLNRRAALTVRIK
jgi:outer membrane protein OmpA-like peptidoglycan-associated protein